MTNGAAPLAVPRRPRIGDTRPAPLPRIAPPGKPGAGSDTSPAVNGAIAANGAGASTGLGHASGAGAVDDADGDTATPKRRRRRGGRGRGAAARAASAARSSGRDDGAGPGSGTPLAPGRGEAATRGRVAPAEPDVDDALLAEGREDELEDAGGAPRSRNQARGRGDGSGPRRSARAGVPVIADGQLGAEDVPSETRLSEARELEPRDDGRAESRRRRGRERNGRPVGRYLMCVHVRPEATQIAVLEGRNLIEHHVARARDDVNQIDGNVYRGRVKNVLPGMEAAFVDIGTPKNAVLYWGDVHAERDDSVEREPGARRIEHLLRPGQTIICQVTKNPIGLKGARLTEEVSLPGRFVVLVPGSNASGISKRLPDNERKRLRKVLDDIRPEGHGVIVRTAAEGVSTDELRRDVENLLARWHEIEEKARRLPAPALLYSEPHLALRVIREEFTEEYRGVVIDDRELYELVRSYVADIDPTLADRVQLYDTETESLPIFERHHVHEQLHKALDRKVWLPSGGSLIIERTEALTVIDVNTGKNVGSSSLEETVFKNNLEAAEEIARQLRLRDIGGIIVIDFIDMEVKTNRQGVMAALRSALARDKTPTQVFDISELGLCEMTRKRVGEGLVETLSETCPLCKGRGLVFHDVTD
jgi:ribonuclease E